MKKRVKNKDRFAERIKTYYYRLVVAGLLSLFLIPCSFAASNDSIYNGTQIKLDILSPVMVAGINHWKIQHYEMATNVRLANRFYPTLELGYTGGSMAKGDSISYSGQGGFFRVGADINPLKKHPESPHALLVGLRIGTAVQQFENGLNLRNGIAADCWGEIVLGCQVEMAKGKKPRANGQAPMAFYMGWMGRFKFLFTRETEGIPAVDMTAIYIPGYGKRDNIAWGANYYLGWRF